MNSLVNTVSEHFVVNNATGEISISNVKCAELLGVAEGSIRKFIIKYEQLPDNNQEDSGVFSNLVRGKIDEKLFVQLVKYYAFESKAKNEKAQKILSKIVDAGARVFLYNQAGYTFKVEEKPLVPQTYNEAIFALADQLRANEKLTLENETLLLEKTENAPKVATFDAICATTYTHCVSDVAKFYDMRPMDLTKLLIDHGWGFRRGRSANLTITDKSARQNLAVQKLVSGVTNSGKMYTNKQLRLTGKGVLKIATLLGIAQDQKLFDKFSESFGIK